MSTTKQEVEIAECSYESIISAFKGTSWEKLAVPLDELYSNKDNAETLSAEAFKVEEIENDYVNSFGMH